MKSHMEANLASQLLAPAVHARFSQLLGVAARKSVFAWQDSSVQQAQLVVLDASSSAVVIRPSPPCFLWIGVRTPATSLNGTWTAYLAPDFTISDLIDVLDRAAVFLMDWRACQRIAHASAAAAGPSVPFTASSVPMEGNLAKPPVRPLGQQVAFPTQSASSFASDPSRRYRLASWTSLPPPHDSPACITAMSILAKQAVSVVQLLNHTNLTSRQLTDLLNELSHRGVLRVVATGFPESSSSTSIPSRTSAPVSKNLLARLSAWIVRANH